MKIQNHISYVHKIMKSIEKNMVMNIKRGIILNIVSSFIAMFIVGVFSAILLFGIAIEVMSVSAQMIVMFLILLSIILLLWFVFANMVEVKELIKQYGENYSRLKRLRESSNEDRR